MKKKSLQSIAIITLCVFSGCASKAGSGALGGAGVGALAGGLGWGSKGALIGAGAGAVGGALIGQSLDNYDRNRMSRDTRQKYERRRQLSVDDIVDLQRQGYSDEQIVGIIDHTKSRFHISQNEAKKLRKRGLSKKLILYMAGTTEPYRG